MKAFPVITIVLSVASILIHLAGEPMIAALDWRFDWAREAALWRPFTGHLCHWSGEHLVWDVALFALLGCSLEARNRGRFLAVLGVTVLLTELLLGWNGDYASYRGLSGWAMALFALSLLELWRRGCQVGNATLTWIGIAGWALLAGKVAFELMAGRALFVSEAPAGFTVAVESHLAGVLAALLVATAEVAVKRWLASPSGTGGSVWLSSGSRRAQACGVCARAGRR